MNNRQPLFLEFDVDDGSSRRTGNSRQLDSLWTSLRVYRIVTPMQWKINIENWKSGNYQNARNGPNQLAIKVLLYSIELGVAGNSGVETCWCLR